ncbi:ankyrin repeat domain-containing protein [Lysobacter antibioticus]|uniref:Ankyrin repeat family protein n=1 Tax=Lysobacter antibioticus TaxID=84531 RepID=A0A0S2FH74_LYSAN|nr:ankyrin repeat domain-containing protein [Lysobacter antibioticus]ALN82871.1 ankyrin repeat family protein [Lysobacter antibioticus]
MNNELANLRDKYRMHEMFVDFNIENFDDRGADGETPLHLATLNGEIDDLRLMLPTVSNIDIPGGIGHTALHYAIMFGYAEVVDALLKNGASLLVENEHGDRPLDLLKENREEVVAAVLNNQPDALSR